MIIQHVNQLTDLFGLSRKVFKNVLLKILVEILLNPLNEVFFNSIRENVGFFVKNLQEIGQVYDIFEAVINVVFELFVFRLLVVDFPQNINKSNFVRIEKFSIFPELVLLHFVGVKKVGIFRPHLRLAYFFYFLSDLEFFDLSLW